MHTCKGKVTNSSSFFAQDGKKSLLPQQDVSFLDISKMGQAVTDTPYNNRSLQKKPILALLREQMQ